MSMTEVASESSPRTGADLRTYMIQQHRMTVGSPLTFSRGERVVAVLSSDAVPGLPAILDVTVLVEMP